MNEIAVIKQLPIITEKIKKVGEGLEKRLEKLNLDNLVCTEETKKEIKDLRTTLGKEFKEFEKQRKDIKTKIMEPYEIFNETYEKEIKAKYQEADETLKDKINEVESEIKNKKETELKEYFEELKTASEIDFIQFADANIMVNLSSSMKSLKTQVKEFVDRVETELKTIKTQEHADEIEVEYRKTLNLNQSIQEVVNRYLALEQLKRIEESAKEKVELEEKTIEKVEEVLQAPDVIEGQMSIEDFEDSTDEILEMTFTVRGTLSQLKQIKQFLENGGYNYE